MTVQVVDALEVVQIDDTDNQVRRLVCARQCCLDVDLGKRRAQPLAEAMAIPQSGQWIGARGNLQRIGLDCDESFQFGAARAQGAHPPLHTKPCGKQGDDCKQGECPRASIPGCDHGDRYRGAVGTDAGRILGFDLKQQLTGWQIGKIPPRLVAPWAPRRLRGHVADA